MGSILLATESNNKYKLYLNIEDKYSSYYLVFTKVNKDNQIEEVDLSLKSSKILNIGEVNQPFDTELILIDYMIKNNLDKIFEITGLDKIPNYLTLYDLHYTDSVFDYYPVFGFNDSEESRITIALVGGILNKKQYIGFEIFDKVVGYRCAILDKTLEPLYGEGYLYDHPDLVDNIDTIIQNNIDIIEKGLDDFEVDNIDDIINIIKSGKDNLHKLNPDPIYEKFYHDNILLRESIINRSKDKETYYEINEYYLRNGN